MFFMAIISDDENLGRFQLPKGEIKWPANLYVFAIKKHYIVVAVARGFGFNSNGLKVDFVVDDVRWAGLGGTLRG